MVSNFGARAILVSDHELVTFLFYSVFLEEFEEVIGSVCLFICHHPGSLQLHKHLIVPCLAF